MDPPSQNQPPVSNSTQENIASKAADEMESNEAKSTNSPTLQKVAYSAFLHIVSGSIYGFYSIYLNISKPTMDEKPFFIAIGFYLLGIGLYLIFVALYYKVLCFLSIGHSCNKCYVEMIVFVSNFCILLNYVKASLMPI